MSSLHLILVFAPFFQIMGFLGIPIGFVSLILLSILLLFKIIFSEKPYFFVSKQIFQIIMVMYILRVISMFFLKDIETVIFNNFFYYSLSVLSFILILTTDLASVRAIELFRAFFLFAIFTCIFNIVYFVNFLAFDSDLLTYFAPIIRPEYFSDQKALIGLFGVKLTRLGSILGSPNLFAAFLIISTPLLLYLNGRFNFLNGFFTCVIIILGILPTGSRTGIVLVTLFIVFHMAFLISHRKYLSKLILLLVTSTIVFYAGASVLEFFQGRSSGSGILGPRLISYKIVYENFDSYAFIGLGYGNASLFAKYSGIGNNIGNNLHNIYLTLIVEQGFVLACAFYIFLVYFVVKTFLKTRNIYFLSSMFMIGAANFFTESLFNYAIMFNVLVWLLVLDYSRKKEKTKPTTDLPI